MGHEYVEMKNSHAAIEAYRRAVGMYFLASLATEYSQRDLDVNRKDYRAWYGLGQAYELLSMHNYALHYYQRATGLRLVSVFGWVSKSDLDDQGLTMCDFGKHRVCVTKKSEG